MSRRKKQPATLDYAAGRPAPPQDDTSKQGFPPLWTDRLALLILLALIPFRTVAAETHTFELLNLFRNMQTPPEAQPATTFVVIALIFFSACLIAWGRSRYGGPVFRFTGMEVGATMLALFGLISYFQAGQKHLALIGTLDFLALIFYCITLRQLIQRPWQIRLVLAVVLATGAMVVAKAGWQKYQEIPDTLAFYQQQKEQMIAENPSIAPGLLHDYEQRMKSSAVTVWYKHANVAGSALILFIMTALAIFLGRFKTRPFWSWGLLHGLALLGCAALVGTQSKGACGGLLIAFCLWPFFQYVLARFDLGRNFWRQMICPILFIGIIFGSNLWIDSIGKSNPESLPRSLLFRTQYWQGADVIINQGPWGIGANNFGRHFPRYKPAACPEDVEHPHSWIYRLVSEWGEFSAYGFIILLIGLLVPKLYLIFEQQTSKTTPTYSTRPGSIGYWLGGVTAISMFMYLCILWGGNPAYVFIEMFIAAAPLLIGGLVLAIESKKSTYFSDRPVGPMLFPIAAALVAFLIHTSIDLALFWPGAAIVFFALLAVAVSLRDGFEKQTEHMPASQGLATGTAIVGIASLLIFTIYAIYPATAAASALRQARSVAPNDPNWSGDAAYRRAIAVYPLDSTAAEELAESMITQLQVQVPAFQKEQGALSPGQQAELIKPIIETLDIFEQRDPYNGSVPSLRVNLYMTLYSLWGRAEHLDQAVEQGRKLVEAYPVSPQVRLRFARMLETQARTARSSEIASQAVEEYKRTLELESQRIYVSKPNRMPPEIIARIEQAITELAAWAEQAKNPRATQSD